MLQILSNDKLHRLLLYLAVDRNASKRRIKEIVRQNGLGDVLGGDYVFSVFRPFAELSYMQAEAELLSNNLVLP